MTWKAGWLQVQADTQMLQHAHLVIEGVWLHVTRLPEEHMSISACGSSYQFDSFVHSAGPCLPGLLYLVSVTAASAARAYTLGLTPALSQHHLVLQMINKSHRNCC